MSEQGLGSQKGYIGAVNWPDHYSSFQKIMHKGGNNSKTILLLHQDLFCLIDVLMELCQIFQLSDKFKSTNSRHDLQDSRERMTANHRKLVWLILVIPKIGQSQYRTGI